MSKNKSSTGAWIWIISTFILVIIVGAMFSIDSTATKVGSWLLMLSYTYISMKTECFTKS